MNHKERYQVYHSTTVDMEPIYLLKDDLGYVVDTFEDRDEAMQKADELNDEANPTQDEYQCPICGA